MGCSWHMLRKLSYGFYVFLSVVGTLVFFIGYAVAAIGTTEKPIVTSIQGAVCRFEDPPGVCAYRLSFSNTHEGVTVSVRAHVLLILWA